MEEMVRGLPHLGTSSSVCEDCLVGKQQRNPFPQESTWRASQVFELVHADICGLINPLSNSNKSRVEKESGVAIKGLRTDRGGEFTSVEFTNFCNDNVGIGRRVTIAGNSNGSGIDATGENIELGSTNVEEGETNTSSEDYSSSSSENLPPMTDAQRRRQPPTWMQ
ncbi:retrovirus-related pol polyprotein from transposon TNT 1-94, partial [Tanacetum coccineum]